MLIVRQGFWRSITRRSAAALLAIFVAAAIVPLCEAFARAANPAPVPPSSRHVLVISVDGMGPHFYVSPSTSSRIPNLRRLMQEGSHAEGVVGVYPSVTYPSHTTIVTGRVPAEHGIYSNLSSREPGKNPDDWFWFSEAIKVPTLWTEVRRASLTSAAVSWPVTVGATIDWNVPEIWDPQKGSTFDPQYVSKFATPGLLEEAMAVLGAGGAGEDSDADRVRLVAYLLKKYRPNLTFLHLDRLDHDQHEFGPGSPQVQATIEKMDELIGRLLAAVKDAELQDSMNVFVVSDHGFLPVEREIRPNVLLANAGLLQADEEGRVTGGKLATVANGGSFFIYWPEGQSLRSKVDSALKPLRDEGIVWGVLNRQALADVGAEPAAQMVLEAPSGASFGSAAKGEVVVQREHPGGTHGYLPFRKELAASFIAWGPGIKPGVNLRRIPMTAIGPTILKALGIDNPQFGVHPPLEDIFK